MLIPYCFAGNFLQLLSVSSIFTKDCFGYSRCLALHLNLVPGIEPRAFFALHKYYTTELHLLSYFRIDLGIDFTISWKGAFGNRVLWNCRLL